MDELKPDGCPAPAALQVLGAPEPRRPDDRPERPSFEAFVLTRSDALLRTAYLLTRDHALAEDLLQTALAKAWAAWRRIDGYPEAYVRTILVNTYATWWRRRWNQERPTESLPEVVARSDVDAHDERQDLWTALGRLPRRQQAAVVLRYYEGLSEAETARTLGCSVGTVKSQTSKALAKLRIDPALSTGSDEADQGASR
jgi:RNA polymerase sigma-70 factor (sigma-E family)